MRLCTDYFNIFIIHIFCDFLKISEDLKPKNKRSLFTGKCVRQQFDVDAKFCCVKNPSDGSGVIAADAGIVRTPDEYDLY